MCKREWNVLRRVLSQRVCVARTGVDAVLFHSVCLTLLVAWRQHSFHDARTSRQHGTPGMYARTRRETLRRSIAKGEVGA
jgi:hypothetical protein